MSEKERIIGKLREKIAEYSKMIEQLNPKGDAAIVETFKEIEDRVKHKPNTIKVGTDIGWLDRALRGGFTRGSFINLAGASFSGKSTLVLEILSNIVIFKKALFFSFEMYEDILIKELRGLRGIQKENLLIVQKGYDIEIVEKIIREKAKEGMIFFAIDSKMKIKLNFDGKEYQQISKLSNMLAKLTQELGIVLILINQMNDEDAKNGKLGLKGSGDQIYDSDVVLFINVEKIGDIERRICYCVKDRHNKRKWRYDITKEDEPEIREYRE